MRNVIRVGSRESALAVKQSNLVIEELKKKNPDSEFELVAMKTTGDKILDKKLDQVGGKGLFVKELELALLEKRVDICVHSLKDMPMEESAALPLVGFSRREDPRDVLVLPEGKKEIDFSKPIGTSSFRRLVQLKNIYPAAIFESVRGNIQTRLRKLDEGQYGALILAAAGLKRLGLENRINRYFEVDEIIPAAGQGIMAIQGRAEDSQEILQDYTSDEIKAIVKAERAFVSRLNGGCSMPIAAHACLDGQELVLLGLYVPDNSESIYKDSIKGDINEASALGEKLADRMLALSK